MLSLGMCKKAAILVAERLLLISKRQRWLTSDHMGFYFCLTNVKPLLNDMCNVIASKILFEEELRKFFASYRKCSVVKRLPSASELAHVCRRFSIPIFETILSCVTSSVSRLPVSRHGCRPYRIFLFAFVIAVTIEKFFDHLFSYNLLKCSN